MVAVPCGPSHNSVVAGSGRLCKSRAMITAPADLEPLLSGHHPPQRAFPYSADRWRAWTGHLDGVGGVLDGLPPAVGRATVATVVEDLLPQHVIGAFTVAMIWGHGGSGYGPYRTAWVLTGSRQPQVSRRHRPSRNACASR